MSRKLFSRVPFIFLLAALIMLLGGAGSLGQSPSPTSGPIASGKLENGVLTWTPLVENAGLVLTVSGPNEYYWQKQFAAGEPAVFAATDEQGQPLPDGPYTFELRIVAATPAEAADPALRGLEVTADAESQSGTVSVADGALIDPGQPEGGIAPLDVVHSDDVIIQGSLCVGFDCVLNESFGFDTIKLKENNVQILFEDTSTTAGFPYNDWRIRTNDSSSGGASYMAIDDVTGNKTPFKITAGARANSIFVNSSGRVGLGTSSPVLDLHIVRGDTPSIRLDQDTSSGWTAQVWDMAGNESNFFVRDTTGGSKLPFRIQPGTPTNSLTLKSDGKVGMGTWSPAYELELERTGAKVALGVQRTDGATGVLSAGAAAVTVGAESQHALQLVTNNIVRVYVKASGKLGIGNSNPSHMLDVGTSGAYCDGGAWVDGSSRAYKNNISALSTEEAEAALAGLNPVRYTYKANPDEEYLGFVAEDVPDLVATADRKGLAPMDIVAVLTSVVKEQQATIEELEARLAALEAGAGQ